LTIGDQWSRVADVGRQLAEYRMSAHCPKCNRPVYSRRQKFCGFCGAELPEELKFTEAELTELAKQDAEAAARRKARKLKDEAEEEERRKADSGASAASLI